MSLSHNADNGSLFVRGKAIFKFLVKYNNVSFRPQFCGGIFSNGFRASLSRQVSLNRNVDDFSVDYRYHTLNIHRYLKSKLII